VPSTRRVGRAVLGGTFDHLHVGHESLLETAFHVGRTVAIGITTGRYLAEHPKPDGHPLQPYGIRRRVLTAWLRNHHPGARWTVVPIDDRFGGSVAPGVDVLVVSADTIAGGRAVNAERRRRGLPLVPVVIVPLALADDLLPVASRRIRAGVIDRDGHRRTAIQVRLRAADAADRRAATRAILHAFPRATVVVGSRKARRDADLAVDLTRSRGGGWRVVLRSSQVQLRPVRVPGTDPVALDRGLGRLLRPVRRDRPGESF
jgi:pantetheine-phosphate adenylyltransferase